MLIKFCNLCGGPIVRITRGPFGTRCLFCRSTFVHRAVGVVLNELHVINKNDIQVYELSAHGALFKYLKKKFRNLTFTEYFDGVAPGTIHHGVLCQDVERLTFPSASFDLVTSTEVFEHVANDANGFKEIHRVLKPGGLFVFTVPLAMKPLTLERARVESGRIIYLEKPTYGGDHLRKNGILDFRNYGMDIIDRLKGAGFSTVEVKDVSRPEIGIPGKHVLVAVK